MYGYRLDQRFLGEDPYAPGRPPAAQHRHPPAVRGPAVEDRGVAAHGRRVHAGLVSQPDEPVARRVRPDVGLRRILGGGEEDAFADGAQHLAHVQPVRAGRVADPDRPDVAAHARQHRHARRGVQGRAGPELDPGVVGHLVQRSRPAGGGVDGENARGALVAGLETDDRAGGGRPVGTDEVVEGAGVPRAVRVVPLGCLARQLDGGVVAVDGDDTQRRLRVGGAGRRVRQRPGRPGGMRRVGDVPAFHAGRVHAGDEERVAVGRPPVAARPSDGLGGGVVGEAVAHVGGLGFGQRPVLGAVGPYDPQGASCDVCDQSAVGGRPGVGDGTGDGKAARGSAAGFHRPQRAVRGVRREAHRPVGRVRGHAVRCPVGEYALVTVGVQPQQRAGIAARGGAQEQHAVAVG